MTIVQEHALVTTARDLLSRRFADQRIATARAAAESLRLRVIASEEDAVMVTAALKQVVEGKKAVDQARRDVLDLPIIKAVLEVVEALKTTSAVALADLKSGDTDGRAALLAFQRQRDEQAERERVAAQATARQAASEAAIEGEDAPPPAEPAPANPSRIVRAGSAQSHVSTKLCVEIHNHHDCDPTWLKLDEVRAKVRIRYLEQTGALEVPLGRSNAVDCEGLKVWRERSVVVR